MFDANAANQRSADAAGGAGGAWGLGDNAMGMMPNTGQQEQQPQQGAPWQQQPHQQMPGQPQHFPGRQQPFAAVQAAHPMAQVGLEYGKNLVHSTAAQYVPGAIALWSSLRYYFQVNNSYVKSKLKILLVPRKKDRTRLTGYSEDSDKECYVPPVHDENAPDLYIPVMAFITYVLMNGLIYGTRMEFTPEVLVERTSTTSITWILEVCLIRGVSYLLNVPSMSLLDLFAYMGYKFVGLCVSFLAGFLFGPTLYYVVLLYTGASMAFYIINVLNNNLDSPAAAASSKHNYLVIAVGLMQILLMWWLGVTPSSLQ